MRRAFTTALFVACAAAACHSAAWSPPEPQPGPTEETLPTATAVPAPIPSAAPSASLSEPSVATSAAPPPVAPSAEPASPASVATPTPLPSSSAEPQGKSKVATKGSHKAPEPAAVSTDAYSGDDPCQGRSFHYSLIGSACKKGGRKAVRDIMRGVVKKAKAAGQDMQCLSCHEDTGTFRLKPNSVSDLKRWL